MPSRRHPCPRCGAASVRIIYGMPDVELFERAERGEVELGGCVMFGDDPTRYCANCGNRFTPEPGSRWPAIKIVAVPGKR